MDESEWTVGELHALAEQVASLAPHHDPVALLDHLEALQRVKSAAAAAQTALIARLAEVTEAGAPDDDRRRPSRTLSVGAEVAVALQTSPYVGEQRLLLARRLRDHLPRTFEALARGELTEDRALSIGRQVEHLEPPQQTLVDADLEGRLVGLGDEKLRQAVRRSCLALAPEAEERRYRRARADRHVTTRQLDDGTGRLTAVLPLEHLAAVRAELDRSAASARSVGDARTGGQVRADTLVARVTGHDTAAPTNLRVNLVIGVESLLGDSPEPGNVLGLGWLPPGVCADMVSRASAAARASLRRLFVTPSGRALVGMECSSRTFDGLLAEFIDLRDGGLCRTPGCNTPIRHRDHVRSFADGGPTSATNGQGLCERCNYAKESPGWTAWVASPPDERHEVRGVTEHLRVVRSTAPPMPGGAGRSPAESLLATLLPRAS